MEKIRKDFIRKEFCRLFLCAAGLAICLCILLRSASVRASFQPLLLVGVPAIVGFAALRSVILARAGIRALTDNDAYFLEREYAAPHPVYRVWQGEIHLMLSFIVSRNRGRLLFIPVHKIERVEQRFNYIGLWSIPLARFVMDTGHSISIGFSPSHSKDSAAVFAWLINRIGREKVKC